MISDLLSHLEKMILKALDNIDISTKEFAAKLGSLVLTHFFGEDAVMELQK